MPADTPRRPVEFGFAVPQIFPDGVDTSVIRETVTRAEAAGFTSLWVMDSGTRPGRSAIALDPLGLLAHVAAITDAARLGTSVLVSALRHPIQLAKDLATIDQLSDGRSIVGVGVGHARRAPVFGLPRAGWADRFEEGLEVLRLLWAPGTATHHGRHWDFADLSLEPKPVQDPHPPLWFGARTEPAMRRAVRLGSGWMGAGSSSGEDFARESAMLRSILAEEGVDEFMVSKRIYLAIGEDARLESRVSGWFDHVYGRPADGPRCAVWGSPARCAEQIQGLIADGVEMVLANPMFDQPRQLELFVDTVLPRLDA